MTATNPFLTQAFELLQQTVQDLLNAGRRRVGAFLKPELVRRTGGSFNEVALGFVKFHDFLRAAEAAHFVTLTKSGPDLEAWPHGSVSASEQAAYQGVPATATPPRSPINTPPNLGAWPVGPASASAPVSRYPTPELSTPVRPRINIRPDLWLAFVDFSPGLLRVYDKTSDRAHKFTVAIYPGESDETTALRRRFQLRDPSLLLIEPITQAAVLDWMRGFAERQSGPLSQQLRVAVNSDHPLQAFTQVVRSQSDLYREWHGHRVEKVAEYIRSFFAQHNLTTQVTFPYDPVAKIPMVGSNVPPREIAADSRFLGTGRAGFSDPFAILQQIDEVIEDLLKLRGTVGYTLSSKTER